MQHYLPIQQTNNLLSRAFLDYHAAGSDSKAEQRRSHLLRGASLKLLSVTD
jgi:hypothetical protein